MDLEQLNKIDISNAAQVKELQTFLKTRGYYNGPIDGKWGGGKALKGRDATQRAEVARIAANPKITSEAANAQMRGMRSARNAVTGAQFGATHVAHSLSGRCLHAREAIAVRGWPLFNWR